MNNFFGKYEQQLVSGIKEQISSELSVKTAHNIAIEDLYNAHIVESRSAKFQRYYFEIISF